MRPIARLLSDVRELSARLLSDVRVVVRDVPDDGPPLSHPRAQRAAQSIAELYLVMVAVMAAWVIYLAFALPERNTALHYDLTWVGFDLFILSSMLATAWFAWKMNPRVQLAAHSTATLLLVDAWMDITTADGSRALLTAVLFALFLELPIAVVSLRIARRINRSIARRALLADGLQPVAVERPDLDPVEVGVRPD